MSCVVMWTVCPPESQDNISMQQNAAKATVATMETTQESGSIYHIDDGEEN